ncbi:hypothetical protein CERSUDRAFT_78630 [Gelatoporia subvermispora B]|uniref:Uncharacterized protein n=1 Tax=Ceriporiopsis subvermispora (strain B) TaxID=914234 RepID=M2Q1S9_CERS8|nr:hypothetical protein CERSUDRAFT_78630 [Gelatoporia subvermispora B]
MACGTRASNKGKKVAAPDMPRSRRTSAQVRAEAEEKEAQQAAKEARTKKGKKAIKEMEDQARADEVKDPSVAEGARITRALLTKYGCSSEEEFHNLLQKAAAMKDEAAAPKEAPAEKTKVVEEHKDQPEPVQNEPMDAPSSPIPGDVEMAEPPTDFDIQAPGDDENLQMSYERTNLFVISEDDDTYLGMVAKAQAGYLVNRCDEGTTEYWRQCDGLREAAKSTALAFKQRQRDDDEDGLEDDRASKKVKISHNKENQHEAAGTHQMPKLVPANGSTVPTQPTAGSMLRLPPGKTIAAPTQSGSMLKLPLNKSTISAPTEPGSMLRLPPDVSISASAPTRPRPRPKPTGKAALGNTHNTTTTSGRAQPMNPHPQHVLALRSRLLYPWQKKFQKLPGSPLKLGGQSSAGSMPIRPETPVAKKTSNAPIANAQQTNADAPAFQLNSYGGLHDEDEKCERDAALSSPIRAGTRVTSQMMISLLESDEEPTMQIVAKPKARTAPTTKKATVATKKGKGKGRVKEEPTEVKLEDDAEVKYDPEALPAHVANSEHWIGVILPTYRRLMGCCTTPFSLPSNRALSLLQDLYDALFPDYPPENISGNPSHPMFKKANARVGDHRNDIAGAAATTVHEFFASQPEKFPDMEARVQYAEKTIEYDSFMYVKAEGDDIEQWTGTLRGPLVLKTLAKHFRALDGALEIKGYDLPIGAIALSATAVRRAFSLYAQRRVVFGVDKRGAQVPIIASTFQAPHQKGVGKLTKSDSDFSGKNWGPYLAVFMETTQGLEPEQLRRITRLAEAMAHKEGRPQPSAGHVTAVNSAGVKVRRHHISHSDVEDDDL